MAENLTTLAKRLRPFILGMVSQAATGSSTTFFNINRIFIYPTSDAIPVQYTKTAANLTTALGIAVSGQVVFINGPCSLTGNYTVPAGVMLRALSRYEVTINGNITLGNDSSLYNLTINSTDNSANALYGVIGPDTGSAYILYCDISATQSGAGNAYAIGATRGASTNNGNLIVRHSKLYGSSVGGSGYAGRSVRGMIYSRHNDYVGSTDRWALV